MPGHKCRHAFEAESGCFEREACRSPKVAGQAALVEAGQVAAEVQVDSIFLWNC